MAMGKPFHLMAQFQATRPVHPGVQRMSGGRSAASGTLDDVVLKEGDEEAVYVYVDLDNLQDTGNLAVGNTVVLKGLDTATPEVQLGTEGQLRAAHYEESIGALLFLKRTVDADGQAGLQYLCHTERMIKLDNATAREQRA